MADLNDTTAAPACPRCASGATTIVARSPGAGAWHMLLCPVCYYSWRNTEPDYATTRAAMAPLFLIDPAKIAMGKVMPEVPPLRDRGG